MQETRSPRPGVCSPPPACVPSAGPRGAARPEGSVMWSVIIYQHPALRQRSQCKVTLRLSAMKTLLHKQNISPLDRLALALAKCRLSVRKENPHHLEG